MPQTVSACLIVDTSASMSSSGYVANTVIDSKAFIAHALAGDAIGVVNYDTNSANCYAPNGAMAVVDATMSQIASATSAISGLTFAGNCTNMGSGINAAYALMTPSGVSPKAAVLLSDGYQNCGTDPLSCPTTFPVFSCAMGPNSDQNKMQAIATRTNGLYYYMPYPVQMMQIYNAIRASQPRIQGVVNYRSQLNTNQTSALLQAQVSATSDYHQFGLVWDNTSYVYSSNPSPTGNQLSIQLYQPDGTPSSITPATIGSGYAVFDIPNPQVGNWNAYVQIPPNGGVVNFTNGVFEFVASSASIMDLKVDVPLVTRAGGPLAVEARMLDDDEPIAIDSIHAEVVSPTISVANALKKYADEIQGVQLPTSEPGHDDDRPERRLAALHSLHLPNFDLMPHRTTLAPMVAQESGVYRLELPDAQPGSHNVIVRASGYSEKSKTRVQRTRLVTVLVGGDA